MSSTTTLPHKPNGNTAPSSRTPSRKSSNPAKTRDTNRSFRLALSTLSSQPAPLLTTRTNPCNRSQLRRSVPTAGALLSSRPLKPTGSWLMEFPSQSTPSLLSSQLPSSLSTLRGSLLKLFASLPCTPARMSRFCSRGL